MSNGREDGQAEFLEGTADNGGNDVKGHWLTREARERERAAFGNQCIDVTHTNSQKKMRTQLNFCTYTTLRMCKQ